MQRCGLTLRECGLWPFMLRRPLVGLAAAALGRAPSDGECHLGAQAPKGLPGRRHGRTCPRRSGSALPMRPGCRSRGVLVGPTPKSSGVSRAGLSHRPSKQSEGREDWLMWLFMEVH